MVPSKLIWWHSNLPSMRLEDTDDFRAAFLLTVVLVIDFLIILSLLLASEYFSAKEVLRVMDVLPIRLLRTERRLSLQPVGVPGLSLMRWEGSLSDPSCTWAESSTSSSLGSSLKMTVVLAAFPVFSLGAASLSPASSASGVWGTVNSEAAGTGGNLATLLSLGEPSSELKKMVAKSFSAGLDALFWRCISVLTWSLTSASAKGTFPSTCWTGGVSGQTSELLADVAAWDLVTRWGGENSLASALISSRFSLFRSRWEYRVAGTSLRLLFLLLDNLTIETVH